MAAAIPSPVVLTGASGFVGQAVAARLPSHQSLSLGQHRWRDAVAGAVLRGRVVVHLAGRAHDSSATARQFDEDNVEKTALLVRAAAAQGATRFVFLSTIKVHGEETIDVPFRSASAAAPRDDYSRSKWRAEEAVRDIATRAGMPWVVIRAPLVYGRGARGNFRALCRLANTSLWLPFAALRNRRSLVHVDDLAEALVLAALQEGAQGRAFLAAHPEAVSTAQLVTTMRAVLGRPGRLVAVPPAVLEGLAGVVGRRAWMQRLTRSLEADSSDLQRDLGWAPRHSLEPGLREALA